MDLETCNDTDLARFAVLQVACVLFDLVTTRTPIALGHGRVWYFGILPVSFSATENKFSGHPAH